jgi:excisionase family DNA binding protein
VAAEPWIIRDYGESSAAASEATMQLPNDLMCVEELAKRLGLNRKTVYDQVKANEIPGVKHFGRRIRIHRPTIEAWLSSDLTRKSA